MATSVYSCVFCDIIKGKEPGEIIYEDEHVSCIKDISPASTHHYLIMPKQHIPTAKDLTRKDAAIFQKMTDTVKVILEQKGLDAVSTRTGFHWPPFHTINHLHLHVISPVESMSFAKKMMFKPNSFWFVSTDYVKSRMEMCS